MDGGIYHEVCLTLVEVQQKCEAGGRAQAQYLCRGET